MKTLTDNVVLITGAAGGFGQSLTRLLLREGCRLILADLSRAALVAAAEAAARAVAGAPGRIIGFVEADLATAEGAERLHRGALAVSPRVDVLVNNAGIGMSGRIDHIPQAKWERLMQVNLLAPMRLTALFLPAMVGRRSGHIVNICSAASLLGAPGLSVYNASKFGLRGFSESLAHDVRRQGVDVTAVYPFFSRTPILQSEQFGDRRPLTLPDHLITDPDRIMAALVSGVKRRRLHIYPDAMARRIHFLRRLSS
jgi:short-subunit dehydrogenase